MKVLMINGSPNEQGCTWRALKEIADTLEKEGIESEILHIGKNPIGGCLGCGGCVRLSKGRCVFNGDPVNKALEKMEQADGLIVGSPVYFMSPNGALLSILDRMFMCGKNFAYKPAACVTSARRAGTTSVLDAINKYFLMTNMPIVSANYGNMVHGHEAAEVEQDLEGLQTMRILGRNMAWMLKSIHTAAIPVPEAEEKIKTSYIR
jgi:multimeric flavodoxin WrbA